MSVLASLRGLLTAAVTATACASQPRIPAPSAAQTAAADTAIRAAHQGGAVDGSAALHLQMAEKQAAEAKERTSNGDNGAARLLLVRAEADAELSQVLRRRERAVADAEVIERQLKETKSTALAGSSSPAETPPTVGTTGTRSTPSEANPSATASVPVPSKSEPTQPVTPDWGRTPRSPISPTPVTPSPTSP